MGTKLATITKTHRPPIGTTYFFTLNETAKVTFTFKQRLSGRKVKGHCIPQTRRYRHKPSCKRSVTKGTLSFTAHTGQNRLAFQGRITRTKKLPPGRYTLQITATLAGKASPPATLTFTTA
ncbi:MAG: hypothetical protein M3076_05010 [Actinomycetota bacterium]|nr:hypothetical protein [Actinomycetota bacterium]